MAPVRTGRRLRLLAAVAAIVVLGACGGKGSGAEGGAAVRGSVDKTVDAGSSRVALNISFSQGGTAATVRGDGLFDLRNKRGTLTLDLGTLGASLGSGTVETVLDADGIYVKLPAGVLPGSKPWFKLDLAAIGEQAGLSLGSLGQLQQSDPTQALAYLKGAANDAKEVGEEDLRGASTTHYRATIDLRRAAESLPEENKRAIDEAIAALGTSTFPADVWIDDEGRMRKLRFSIDPDGTGPSAPGSVEMELYDFGVPADVRVPPADQTTDLTQLFQGGTIPSTSPTTVRR